MGAAARGLQHTLGLLLLGTLLHGLMPAAAPRCRNQQQAFCNTDVAIRTKVVNEELDSGNNIYRNPIKRIQMRSSK
ncbi:Metalloproteinase inhibitor 2 [Pteropus alecto]|uniref:Metalloproteinase inhibitor 2 n=1 Tax=Pteropus alecto TaxID=9402 RepID=L5KPQ8_PTEAL|nr:Metalloproteinase inhibitor 2 [Pteropus alecto]